MFPEYAVQERGATAAAQVNGLQQDVAKLEERLRLEQQRRCWHSQVLCSSAAIFSLSLFIFSFFIYHIHPLFSFSYEIHWVSIQNL